MLSSIRCYYLRESYEYWTTRKFENIFYFVVVKEKKEEEKEKKERKERKKKKRKKLSNFLPPKSNKIRIDTIVSYRQNRKRLVRVLV